MNEGGGFGSNISRKVHSKSPTTPPKEETLQLLLNIAAATEVKRVAVHYHGLLSLLVNLIPHQNVAISDLAVLALREVLTIPEHLHMCIETPLMAVALACLKERTGLVLKNLLDLIGDLLQGDGEFQSVFEAVPGSFKQIVTIFEKNNSKMIAFSLLKITKFVLVAVCVVVCGCGRMCCCLWL